MIALKVSAEEMRLLMDGLYLIAKDAQGDALDRIDDLIYYAREVQAQGEQHG